MRIIKLTFIFLIVIFFQSCIKTSSSKVSSLDNSKYIAYLYGPAKKDGDTKYICKYKLEGRYSSSEYIFPLDSSITNETVLNILTNPIDYWKQEKTLKLDDIIYLLKLPAEEDNFSAPVCKLDPYVDTEETYEKFLIKIEDVLHISSRKDSNENDTWDKYNIFSSTQKDIAFHYKKEENQFVFVSNKDEIDGYVERSKDNTPCYPYYDKSSKKLLLKMVKDINDNLSYLNLKEDDCLTIYNNSKQCLSLTYNGFSNQRSEGVSPHITTCTTAKDFYFTKIQQDGILKYADNYLELTPKL